MIDPWHLQSSWVGWGGIRLFAMPEIKLDLTAVSVVASDLSAAWEKKKQREKSACSWGNNPCDALILAAGKAEKRKDKRGRQRHWPFENSQTSVQRSPGRGLPTCMTVNVQRMLLYIRTLSSFVLLDPSLTGGKRKSRTDYIEHLDLVRNLLK